MSSSFLHEDRPVSQDELPAPPAPQCQRCQGEMWLIRVTKVISDRGVQGSYRFECRSCSFKETVEVRADNPAAIPIVPSL
jgi:hypothetical protein